MLSKCLNPDCPTTFRYLKEGRLFRVELPFYRLRPAPTGATQRRNRPVEHFWLCKECARSFVLTVDAEGAVHLLPHKPMAAAPPAATMPAEAVEAHAG